MWPVPNRNDALLSNVSNFLGVGVYQGVVRVVSSWLLQGTSAMLVLKLLDISLSSAVAARKYKTSVHQPAMKRPLASAASALASPHFREKLSSSPSTRQDARRCKLPTNVQHPRSRLTRLRCSHLGRDYSRIACHDDRSDFPIPLTYESLLLTRD